MTKENLLAVHIGNNPPPTLYLGLSTTRRGHLSLIKGARRVLVDNFHILMAMPLNLKPEAEQSSASLCRSSIRSWHKIEEYTSHRINNSNTCKSQTRNTSAQEMAKVGKTRRYSSWLLERDNSVPCRLFVWHVLCCWSVKLEFHK